MKKQPLFSDTPDCIPWITVPELMASICDRMHNSDKLFQPITYVVHVASTWWQGAFYRLNQLRSQLTGCDVNRGYLAQIEKYFSEFTQTLISPKLHLWLSTLKASGYWRWPQMVTKQPFRCWCHTPFGPTWNFYFKLAQTHKVNGETVIIDL